MHDDIVNKVIINLHIPDLVHVVVHKQIEMEHLSQISGTRHVLLTDFEIRGLGMSVIAQQLVHEIDQIHSQEVRCHVLEVYQMEFEFLVFPENVSSEHIVVIQYQRNPLQ